MSSMKRITVGILAAIALAGCGVGVDDPEGQAAVAGAPGAYGVSSANLARESGVGDTAGSTAVSTTPATATGTVAPTTNPAILPQDPVPMLPEGHSAPKSSGGVLPDRLGGGTDPGDTR